MEEDVSPELEAAAEALYKEGEFHKWWKGPAYERLDPIGRSEFLAIVQRVLAAAEAARTNASACAAAG